MKQHVHLVPGIPDDDNRDYLPESLKNSTIVVNENGNNSQPYPQRLEEHTGAVIDDVEDTWYTYVPASYKHGEPTPLVVSMHGGLMTGWGQAAYTSWTLLAEREGFIVLFPSASQRRFWLVEVDEASKEDAVRPNPSGVYLNPPPDNPDDNHDMRLVLALIEKLSQQYTIDRGRIFMQGMSMGNIMTKQFARYFGDVLAGAAGSGGPTAPTLLFDSNGEPINRAGALAIWQTRLELDAVPPHYGMSVRDVLRLNRNYWQRINGCDAKPAISIQGEDNLAFYRGELAPMVFRDVKNRDHGQTFDDAEFVWQYLFSGVSRQSDGTITADVNQESWKGDEVSVAVSAGRSQAWLHGDVVPLSKPAFAWTKLKYHGLEGDSSPRGRYVYVPVSFLRQAFKCEVSEGPDGQTAVVTTPDGTTVEVARGVIGALVDGRVRSMLAEAVWRDGELHISLEWFAHAVMGLWASQSDDVVYVTDHHSLLSKNMAHLIDDLLVDRD